MGASFPVEKDLDAPPSCTFATAGARRALALCGEAQYTERMQRAVVVGGGIGGLSAACELALEGFDVQLFEANGQLGGKMARRTIAGQTVDIGPSVLTLPEVFEALFARAGESLRTHLPLAPLPQLARHVWPGAGGSAGTTLDLFVNAEHNAHAIGEAFGRQAAQGYRAFATYSEQLWQASKDVFVFGPKPSMSGALWAYGRRALQAAQQMDGRRSMQAALLQFFPHTPQLRQLFGRYATYAGSSPLSAPATLHLIAHVERLGSWQVPGGLSQLAQAVAGLAARLGVRLHTQRPVRRVIARAGQACGVRLWGGEDIAADVVVLNVDASLRPDGYLWYGDRAPQPVADREGLSARTWSMLARTAGVPLSAHTVLFAQADERAEYQAVFSKRQVAAAPNVYVCAPDRGPLGQRTNGGAERLFCLVNAPPSSHSISAQERQQWTHTLTTHLNSMGLHVTPTEAPIVQAPSDFARRFPSSDGILYGAPATSWRDFFRRPGSRTALGRCLRAGGGVHPGPGVPMAALSGMYAAQAAAKGLRSTPRWPLAAMRGGTSMPKATTRSLN